MNTKITFLLIIAMSGQLLAKNSKHLIFKNVNLNTVSNREILRKKLVFLEKDSRSKIRLGSETVDKILEVYDGGQRYDTCDFKVIKETAHKSNKSYEGTYNLSFILGSNSIPGDMELLFRGGALIGKLTVHLPNPLNVSLVQEVFEKERVVFNASSPVVTFTFSYDQPKDSISGNITLTANQSIPFKGKQISRFVKESLVNSFDKTPIFIEDSGTAFPTLSPDGSLIVYSSYDKDFLHQTLKYRTRRGGVWGNPEVLPFSGKYSDRSPSFGPKGKYLYFSSKRPLNGNTTKSDYDIWYIKRGKNNSWGEPKRLEGINSEANDYQPCVTKRGIFFTSERAESLGGQDIFYGKGSIGKFAPPMNLGDRINSEHGEMSAWVDPKEETMILASTNPKFIKIGNDDLILFKKENNEWVFKRSLSSEINSFANEYGAWLSMDGKWLYYTSDIRPKAKIYRTKANLIE